MNDSLYGRYYQYYLNGEIRLKGKFNMGFPDGRWKTYDSSGELMSIQIFNKGELINTILK
jgi:antitoxin component YwqK of YwqJK toxin-antitoxin module